MADGRARVFGNDVDHLGLSGHNHPRKGMHPSLLKVVKKLVLEEDTEWVCTTKEASLKVDLCLLCIDLEAAGGRGSSEAVRVLGSVSSVTSRLPDVGLPPV